MNEKRMSAFYFGAHDIQDRERFEEYLAQVVPMIEKFGGRYLTKGSSHEVLEGDWRPERAVVIQFPDMSALKAWYHSPEYQPLIALRRSAAKDVMIALEGL